MSVHPISLQQIHTVYWSGLTIGIWDLRDNYAHRKIRKILLGSAWVGRCPRLSNRCTFWLANQQAGRYVSDTDLELNGFWPLLFGELMWHLSTQRTYSNLAYYITVFDTRRDKRRRFIPFLVYALVYPSIASNFVTLDTLSTWSDSVCTYTYSQFLRKPLLRRHRTIETGLIIKW